MNLKQLRMSDSSSSTSNSSGRSRTVQLLCPAMSKLVRYVALEEKGLDVGTIAGTFGLDPSTLRLNDHFVSRGANLISSVTWKSLLSFFASRGFSTGSSPLDPVLVHGKPSVPNSVRHMALGRASVIPEIVENNSLGNKRKPDSDEVSLFKKRKEDQCKSGITQFTYSCFNKISKRPREDEMVLTAVPLKRR